MLFLAVVLLALNVLIAWTLGMVYHRRRMKRESERSAVWQANKDFHDENPGMPLMYYQPHTWDQLLWKIDAAFSEARRVDFDNQSYEDRMLRDEFITVACTGDATGILFADRG